MAPLDAQADLTRVLVTLLRGVLYRESDPQLWQALERLQGRVREHATVLGLELLLDDVEGFAFLRQRAIGEGDQQVPRLVPRRQLGYHVSLLLALLRKKLAEFDAASSESRLILSREDISQLVRVFVGESTNEAGLADRLDAHINKIAEMGFLRPLKGRDDHFEVCRIIKSFVDAQWLSELDGRLGAYRQHFARLNSDGGGALEQG